MGALSPRSCLSFASCKGEMKTVPESVQKYVSAQSFSLETHSLRGLHSCAGVVRAGRGDSRKNGPPWPHSWTLQSLPLFPLLTSAAATWLTLPPGYSTPPFPKQPEPPCQALWPRQPSLPLSWEASLPSKSGSKSPLFREVTR